MTSGDRIRARRIELKMSQEELAKKLGYQHKTSINKIELGHQNLTQSKIVKIAEALETTPAYIMGWEDEPQTEKEKQFVELYSTMSADQQDRILEYMRFIISQH